MEATKDAYARLSAKSADAAGIRQRAMDAMAGLHSEAELAAKGQGTWALTQENIIAAAFAGAGAVVTGMVTGRLGIAWPNTAVYIAALTAGGYVAGDVMNKIATGSNDAFDNLKHNGMELASGAAMAAGVGALIAIVAPNSTTGYTGNFAAAMGAYIGSKFLAAYVPSPSR